MAIHPQANAMQGDPIQLEILKLLQQMQQSMMVTPSQQSNDGNNNNGGNNKNRQRGRRRQPHKTPDEASFNRRFTNKYCWMHGACGHNSKECNIRATGHQEAATLEQRLGGSNAFCSP